MSDLQQGMDCPWFSSYDKGVPHDIVIPEGGLQNILDTAAETYGQREAIVFQNTHISYRELKELAEKLAASLRRRGVRPGDRVSIMLPNLPQTFIAFWGVMKAGAVAVMTNPLYMESELTHQIKDSGAKHLITLDIFWPKIAALREQLELDVCYVTRVRDALKFPLSWLQPFSARRQGTWVPVPFDGKEVVAWKDLFKTTERLSVEVTDAHETIALLQYTGGTTGLSKGAMLTHANLLANLTQLMAIIQQPPEKEHVFLALLPLFHVFGLTITLLLPARMAARVVPMPRYVPADMLEAFKKYQFTAFIGAPSVYISLLQQKNLAQYDLHHIIFCISGSAPMPVEWLKKFEEVTGTPITEGFGLTEASPVTHANPVFGKQKPGSIGVPVPGTLARIVDTEDGERVLAHNEIGELVIKGPQVMKGYWNRPEETARTIRDGWLYTGDIAYMDEEGYFYIVDRKKDLIIVGGYNVYPREIDEVLHTHPKIREAVTVGVNHRSRGETVKAYIVPEEGANLTVPEVVAFCRQKLASFKVPRLIEFREELPKTMVGKVLRRILREEEISSFYEKMASSSNVTIHRSWQDCVQRLLVRGLLVVGTGDTEYDALYDLLSCRFIIPIGAAWPLRVLSFLKLTFLEGISWKIPRRLFHVDARSACEKKVIRLARQTPLSCAEIIKCIEMDIRRLKDGYDVLDKLYDDNDLNCDNFAQAVREYRCSHEVITAVANLYLRQQIMIDTY